MALKPKVTVASVKRKWEERYADLNRKYENLCQAHMDLARNADEHRNKVEELNIDLTHAVKLGEDLAITSIRQQGVIKYLEGKLDDKTKS